MDGGLDQAISEFFGWHVQDRLQAKIRERHHGELLVGQGEIVATDHAGSCQLGATERRASTLPTAL